MAPAGGLADTPAVACGHMHVQALRQPGRSYRECAGWSPVCVCHSPGHAVQPGAAGQRGRHAASMLWQDIRSQAPASGPAPPCSPTASRTTTATTTMDISGATVTTTSSNSNSGGGSGRHGTCSRASSEVSVGTAGGPSLHGSRGLGRSAEGLPPSRAATCTGEGRASAQNPVPSQAPGLQAGDSPTLGPAGPPAVSRWGVLRAVAGIVYGCAALGVQPNSQAAQHLRAAVRGAACGLRLKRLHGGSLQPRVVVQLREGLRRLGWERSGRAPWSCRQI